MKTFLLIYISLGFVTVPLTIYFINFIVRESLDFLFNKKYVTELTKRVGCFSLDNLEDESKVNISRLEKIIRNKSTTISQIEGLNQDYKAQSQEEKRVMKRKQNIVKIFIPD